jgi:hypothetical protein
MDAESLAGLGAGLVAIGASVWVLDKIVKTTKKSYSKSKDGLGYWL